MDCTTMGPFQLLEGEEYENARDAANQMNEYLHKTDTTLQGLQIHELQPETWCRSS